MIPARSGRVPLRGAIVGYGHVADAGHMPFWRDCPQAEIIAAVDSDPARLALFEEGGGRGHPTLDALLAGGRLDFVDICTSPSSHAALIEAALAAGLHVLCEKPLTIDLADTTRVAQAAATSGRVVHTVHNWLHAPACREISRLLSGGVIGAVRRIEWRTLRTAPAVAVGGGSAANWRLDPRVAGGGILIDHGWHAIYCVAAWAGTGPLHVRARLENRRFLDLGVEDSAMLDLDFGTAQGRIELTWAADQRANSLTVDGTDGRLELDGATLTLDRDGVERRWTCPPSLAEGSHHPDWFARLAEEFLDAVLTGGPNNLAAAVTCSAVIEAARRSSAAGGVSEVVS